MKTKKLMRRLATWFDERERRMREERAALEELVRQLGEKCAELEAELGGEPEGSARAAKLGQKLALARAQRDKGERALRDWPEE